MTTISSLLITVLAFTLLFVGYFRQVTAMTQDLGRHFLLGEIILKTKQVPLTNLFSYTYPDFPFINMHWLSEVIFYLIYSASGFHGLQIMTVLTVLAAFGLVFFLRFKTSSPIALGLVSLLYLRVLFERTDIRPELFSFLFLAIFVTVLYRYRERFTPLIFLLIPLELIWVNTHIYFIIGIGVLGLFCIDTLITHRKNLLSKHVIALLLVTLAAGLMTLANPSGLTGALYPLNVFENYGYTIEENQTIFLLESLGFQKPSIFYFKLSVLLLFISLFASWKKTKPVDWLLTIAFTIIGASAVRNLPLFVIATFPACAVAVTHLLSFVRQLIVPEQSSFSRYAKPAAVSILAFLFLWTITATLQQRTFGFGVRPGAEKAVNFFLQQNLKGPLFNNFDIGSYLDYRLYPKERVFIDGRPGEYPAAFFREVYIPMQEDPKIFTQIAKKYNFNTIFFSHTDQTPWAQSFLSSIVRHPDWKIVYLDPMIIILVKDTPENVSILKKHAMSLDQLTVSHLSPQDTNALLQTANFYSITGLETPLIATLQQILKNDPENCSALGGLTSYYTQAQHPAAGVMMQRYETSCR